jgi:hypothetical protein
MQNARDASSLARIAGRVGFAGPTLSVFSPLLAGFFLSLGRILRNLEQSFHALLKVLLRLFSFVIFVFFWHIRILSFYPIRKLKYHVCSVAKQKNRHHNKGDTGTPTPRIEEKKPNIANTKPESALKKAEHWLDRNRIMAGLTVLILSTYVIGNVFSCNQLNITRSTLEVDQRAWLKVDLSAKMLVIENSPIIATVTLTNTGKTPAKDIAFAGVIEIVKNGSEPTFDGIHSVNTYTSNMLFPGESTVPPIQMKNLGPGKPFAVAVPLSHEAYQDLVNGGSWIAVWGRATYHDFFGNQRWVNFCGWNSPSPLHIAINGAPACTKFNDMN